MKKILHRLINLYLDARAAIIAVYKKWRGTLHVSPLTRYVCDKMILDAVKRTNKKPWYKRFRLTRWLTQNMFPKPVSCALYNLAKKAKPERMKGASMRLYRYPEIPKTGVIGGEQLKTGTTSYISLPPGWGHVNPWPSEAVLCTADMQAERVAKGLDCSIVDQIVSHTKASERVTFKKCMTLATLMLKQIADIFKRGDAFHDGDGYYLICATSRDRIETPAFTRDGYGWEDVEFYGDYIDRPTYAGEYGRLKVGAGLYIVFLTTLDDKMQFALLFGPDAITVTPLERNLRTLFRRTAKGERGEQPRGFDMGFWFQFGAKADLSKCVVLEATKRIGGKV